MKKDLYHYYLPKRNIALTPASPRDSAKLFVYDTVKDQIYLDKFYRLANYLPEKSFLMLNRTKVVPARVVMKKETGGKVVVLFLINEIIGGFNINHQLINKPFTTIKFMADRAIKLGEKIYFDQNHFLKVISQNKQIFVGEWPFSYERLIDLLNQYGQMPIPLYLRKTPLQRDDLIKKYQTIFAEKPGSIAAPTASLHFTHRLFQKLEKKGIKKYFITLNIGLGTFAPVSEENIKQKKLHEEYFEVEEKVWEKINKEKEEGKKLIAVGTTVVRTLESLKKFKNQNSKIKMTIQNSKFFGKTNLFIMPPFDFQMTDIIITNFHLPNSSLMMLVEAFLQHKKAKKHLVDLYHIAIKSNFRFYSFGDGMVIK